MFPDEFEYHQATEIREAIDLLEEHSTAETELLAGGHSLLPLMKSGLSSPDVLIDISDIDELQGVALSDVSIEIGAATRYSELVNDEEARSRAPALVAAVEQVADRQVRNRGTIGGNVAHADPMSDLPGAILASDASLVVEGPEGERSVPAEEFYQGMFATSLGPAEVLTRIEIPAASDAVGTYAKKPSPSSGYPIVGVAVLLWLRDDTVESVRLGANGIVDHGVRLEAVEDALIGGRLTEESIETAAARAADRLDTGMVMDDIQASAEYRIKLLEVYTKRALDKAVDRPARPAAKP